MILGVMQICEFVLGGLCKASDSVLWAGSVQPSFVRFIWAKRIFSFAGEFSHFFVDVMAKCLHSWAGKVLGEMINFMNFKLFNSLAAKM